MDPKSGCHQCPACLPYSFKNEQRKPDFINLSSLCCHLSAQSLSAGLTAVLASLRSAQLVCSWQIQKAVQIRAHALGSTASSWLYILKH